MRFFLDNNMSPKFAPMLGALGEDVRHISSVEGLTRDAPDDIWIPAVASKEWIAVGGDSKILSRPHELECVRDHGLIYFIFDRAFMSTKLWDQAIQVLKAWPNIRALASGAKAGTCFHVKVPTGKVELYR